MTVLHDLLERLGCPDREPGQGERTQDVDVEALLDEKAAAFQSNNRVKLDWRHSVVHLMKSLGMDPSIENRRALDREFGPPYPHPDKMEGWLHREIMRRAEKNGARLSIGLVG